MLVGNPYSPGSNTPLIVYRVKKEFTTSNGVWWPVGAIRLWTAPEAAQFGISTWKESSINHMTAEVWFTTHFEEVEWK